MKITWADVFKDFKQRYPNLRTVVFDWRPFAYAEIIIELENKDRVIYNYDMKQVRFVQI